MVRARGSAVPILVGGAVVEFDTASEIVSGDFDFVSFADEPFAAALVSLGFEQGDGLRFRKHSFVHPTLGFGVELVSGSYFDGRGDLGRVRLVAFGDDGVAMAPTEELIADRLGQWVGLRPAGDDMRLQAIALMLLADDLDLDYLDARIQQDTDGHLDLAAFRRLCDEGRDIG